MHHFHLQQSEFQIFFREWNPRTPIYRGREGNGRKREGKGDSRFPTSKIRWGGKERRWAGERKGKERKRTRRSDGGCCSKVLVINAPVVSLFFNHLKRVRMHNQCSQLKKNSGSGTASSPYPFPRRLRHSCPLCPTHFLVPSGAYVCREGITSFVRKCSVCKQGAQKHTIESTQCYQVADGISY